MSRQAPNERAMSNFWTTYNADSEIYQGLDVNTGLKQTKWKIFKFCS